MKAWSAYIESLKEELFSYEVRMATLWSETRMEYFKDGSEISASCSTLT